MDKIEKLRKQQVANANKLEKAKSKRWLKWFKGCLKLIKKRIKQAVKNGESLIEVQANDLYRVVSWKISDEFDFDYLAKRIIEKLHEEGFYSFYYPGCAWVPAYVKVGDSVAAGDTVCLIEAMKTYNPVKAHKGGRVSKILVESGDPVEYGAPLIIIE